jgi:periplasmic protein TonB
MPTEKQHAPPKEPQGANRLSVRPDDGHPAELRFMLETSQKRAGGALGASLAVHGALLGFFLLIAWLTPESVREAVLPVRLSNQLVFLAEPGPGGGGGGGNSLPEPPREAELPGEEEVTVPVVVEPEPTPEPPEETPVEQMNIPAMLLAAATTSTLGVIESNEATASTGSGAGSGAGGGQGSGLEDGTGGGLGGGVYRPGSGVVNPRILREVKPQYTADAMRAKVQGTVLLECVVLADGTVGRVDVVRSLDPTFGLDQEAVKAARQWQFQPGTRFGEPVNVLVTIELTFTLR